MATVASRAKPTRFLIQTARSVSGETTNQSAYDKFVERLGKMRFFNCLWELTCKRKGEAMRAVLDGPNPFDASELVMQPPAHWYAIQTRSNFERTVLSDLGAGGVGGYLPCFAEVHQWKDRKKLVERALFPGYVFARFVNDAAVRLRVLQARGSVRILGHCGSIEPIPDAEIEAIQRALSAKRPLLAHPFLRVGAWVRVRRGPLKDVEGRLVRVKNCTRLVLSISLLSQSVATEIDAADVEVIQRRTGSIPRDEGVLCH